ncbi:MAG: hypothetical protein JSS30_03580 [Verrucomicrobia bacterium]|nr:hypothetical protein [Verrucomicrobiota bacterium]
MSIRIGQEGSQMIYQLGDEQQKIRTDAELITAAKAAIKAGRFAEAGALVKSIKDAKQKDDTFVELMPTIENVYGSHDTRSYDGIHAFLNNFEAK